ncbi:hypothetical protein SC206_10350 [Rouxiella sp. T17]|uniref:hypothetical protein n=1 Tax=Rouxiella sp. T17 TaxID=3085684 RepID=UPI002FC79D27
MTLITSVETSGNSKVENKDQPLRCINFYSTVDNIKNSIHIPSICSEWIWKIGDNTFQLSTKLIEQLQQRYDINKMVECPDTETQTLAALSFYLNPQQNKLPVHYLLGPTSAFCVFYATLSRLLGHTISRHTNLACLPLATYLAGSCESLMEGDNRQLNPTKSLAWQTPEVLIGHESQDLFLDICPRQNQNLACRAPPEIGLPNHNPLYGPRSENQLYWLAPQSTALYRSALDNPAISRCERLGNNKNITNSPQNSAALFLDIDTQHQLATVAVVSEQHPLTINTQQDAKALFYLPEREGDGAENKHIAVKQYNDSALKGVIVEKVERSVWDMTTFLAAQFFTLPLAKADLPPTYFSPWRPRLPVDAPSVDSAPIITVNKDYLYQLNTTDEAGTSQPLFAKADSAPNCLATLSTAPAAVKAVTLLEMIHRLHLWIEQLSTSDIEQTIHRYISQQSQAWGINLETADNAVANRAYIELISCFDLTMKQGANSESLAYSPEETQKFLTLLLADSPFEHNEELHSALIASSLAEPLLGKLLFKALANALPIGSALLDIGYQRLRYFITAHGPLTYAVLNTLLQDIQSAVKNNLVKAVNDKHDSSNTLLEARQLAKILFWHQRMLEYAYPFFLLRDRQDLKEKQCLSREGLLINLGVMRLPSTEIDASVTAKELSALGQDLLLNSSIDELLNECSALENLFLIPGQTAGRGIHYLAEQLKREGVLVLSFIDARRLLTEQLNHPNTSIVASKDAYLHYLQTKRQLYAFALQNIPSLDQQLFNNAYKSVSKLNAGIKLNFIRMSDSRQTEVSRVCIGFTISCDLDSEDNQIRKDNDRITAKRHYFISLLPIQSDTTQALAFDLSTDWPDTPAAQLALINGLGKSEFVARLSPEMTPDINALHFYIQGGGDLVNSSATGDWAESADRLAREITERQFVNLTVPIVTKEELHPANIARTQATKGSWFTRALNQLIYLTPIGNCKDAITEISHGQVAAAILDGAFCLYAFFPAGSEEELGIKTVANVIKNALKSLMENSAEPAVHAAVHEAERPPLLGKLEQTLHIVEQELKSSPWLARRVKHCPTANHYLKPLLLSPTLYTSISIGEIPQAFMPATVWREPLHDILYFVLNIGMNSQIVYRLDEVNKLLLPNPSAALKAMILRQSEPVDITLMHTALNTGDTRQLRIEIYQQERMSAIKQHALPATAEAPINGEMISDTTSTGKLYYPALKLAGSDSLYLLALAGVEEDQQLVVMSNEGELSYWRDNAIILKSTRPQDLEVSLNDPYQKLLNSIENVPTGWTLHSLWFDESQDGHIVAVWSDAEKKLHYRQPNQVGKWLPWNNEQRGIFCQHLIREKRNLPESELGVTSIFSPEHCGYLALPRSTDPERAAALDGIIEQFNDLRPPLIFDTLNCIKQATAISVEFATVWNTFPMLLRELINGIRFSKIEAKSYHDFDVVASKVIAHKEEIDADQNLTCEEKSYRLLFLEKLRVLLFDYRKLQLNSLEARARHEQYSSSLQYYYDQYIAKNLKFNHWINRWFERIKSADKIHGSYIIKATSPSQIAVKYPFLYQGVNQALAALQNKAQQLASKLSDSVVSTEFVTHLLSGFFGEDFDPQQCARFTSRLKRYLAKVKEFSTENIVVVADRLSGKKLASGCLSTPMEKIAFGDGAYSFVYNSYKDKNVYLFDYLSSKEFIEFALAHELGHLTFDNYKYVLQNEIYLKSGSISKNFNILGASTFARHLMRDKTFFLDYISKSEDFAYAFYRHFLAHATVPSHRKALQEFHDLMLDQDSSNPLYLHDKAMRKSEMSRLIDIFFSLPELKLDITYYNPDLFSGLFGYAFQLLASAADGNNNRPVRSTELEQQHNSEKFFSALILRFLHEKYIV